MIQKHNAVARIRVREELISLKHGGRMQEEAIGHEIREFRPHSPRNISRSDVKLFRLRHDGGWIGRGVKEKSADGIGHEIFVPLLELGVDRQDGWKQKRAKWLTDF